MIKFFPSRHMKVLFSLSLAMNVLLIGIVIGMAVRSYYDHPWHETRRTLSPEAQHHFARASQRTHREVKPLIAQARNTRTALMRVIAEDSFNEGEYERLSKKLTSLQVKIAEAKAQGVKELISELPDEDRKTFSRHFAQQLGSPHRRGAKHD